MQNLNLSSYFFYSYEEMLSWPNFHILFILTHMEEHGYISRFYIWFRQIIKLQSSDKNLVVQRFGWKFLIANDTNHRITKV